MLAIQNENLLYVIESYIAIPHIFGQYAVKTLDKKMFETYGDYVHINDRLQFAIDIHDQKLVNKYWGLTVT
jgi:hypothetical protein